MQEQVGFGGNCHWCTEAIFSSLLGVTDVKQGWIASQQQPERYSEAVIVIFEPEIIPLEALIRIHLHTHSSSSSHILRDKYRSAVYTFSSSQQALATAILQAIGQEFPEPLITEVIEFHDFKPNKPQYLNYYYSDPSRPFCQNIISPKLRELMQQFSALINPEKLSEELLVSAEKTKK